MRTLLLYLLLISFAVPQPNAQTPAASPKTAEKPAAVPAKDPVKENDPLEMLQQAYYAGGQLPTDQHAYQMGALVIIAAKMKHPMLRQWAHETLQLTQGLPQRGMRTPTENGALSALADVDPAEALQMLTQLPPPTVTANQAQRAPSDFRTNTAGTIFRSIGRECPLRMLR